MQRLLTAAKRYKSTAGVLAAQNSLAEGQSLDLLAPEQNDFALTDIRTNF
jgi:hypothetical protein